MLNSAELLIKTDNVAGRENQSPLLLHVFPRGSCQSHRGSVNPGRKNETSPHRDVVLGRLLGPKNRTSTQKTRVWVLCVTYVFSTVPGPKGHNV